MSKVLSPGARWDLTVRAYLGSNWGHDDSRLGDDFGIAVAQRPTSLFSVGDVAILVWMNGGGERQLCFCRTRKGITVRDFFVQYARYTYEQSKEVGQRHVAHHNKTIFRVVEHPGELEGLFPVDPAVRRFVVEYLPLAGDAAPRVSEDSPGPSKGSP